MSRTERCACGGSITVPHAARLNVGLYVATHNETERHQLWRMTRDLDPLTRELSQPGPRPEPDAILAPAATRAANSGRAAGGRAPSGPPAPLHGGEHD